MVDCLTLISSSFMISFSQIDRIIVDLMSHVSVGVILTHFHIVINPVYQILYLMNALLTFYVHVPTIIYQVIYFI